MSKQANPTAIGGFVLGALALVVVAILVFSSGALFRERIEMVTYFPGSVQGLNVGAQVQFQGVPIGQVTQIGVDYLPDRDGLRIPVEYEIWPQQVHVIGGAEDVDVRAVMQRLVDEKGLRARLESVSFVTGQYLVALSLNPQLRSRSYKRRPGDPIRVPAIAATRDRVEEMFESLDLESLVGNATDTLAAVRDLAESGAVRAVVDNLNLALQDTRRLLATVERELPPLTGSAEKTLAEYGTLAERLRERVDPLADELERTSADLAGLARSLDARVVPLTTTATGTLEEAGRAMRAISALAGEGSSTRHELDRLLAEATRAAQSLRSLSDYLERHPESLLHGKR